MKHLITLAVVLLALTSCRTTRYIEVPRTTHDTVWHERHVRDSIFVRDSVIITRSGDTVTVDRWRIRWRDRIIRDTVSHVVRDTVTIVRPAEPARLTWWQQTQIYISRVAMALLGLAVIWRIIKLKFKI